MSGYMEGVEAHDMECPFCGAAVDYLEDLEAGAISYWGEDDDKTGTCGCCGRDFHLREHVVRTWTVSASPIPR